MSDPYERYRQITSQWYNNPQFKKMDYKDQVQARAIAASQLFSQDENYRNLHPQVRDQFIREVATQPPALENEDSRKLFGDDIERVARGEDPGILPYTISIGGSYSLFKYGSNVAEKLIPGLEEDNLTWEDQFGEDAKKVRDYMVAKNPDKALGVRLASIGGMVLDIVSYNLLAAPAARGLAALGEAKAAATGGRALRAKRWVNRVAIPQAAEASMEGAFGVAREKTLETGMADDLEGVAKTFGFYALEDYVTGAAMMTAFPFFKTSIGKTFAKKRVAKGEAPRNAAEMDEWVRRIEDGAISPEKIRQLEQTDPITADTLVSRAQVKDIVNNRLDDINYNPGDYGQWSAHNMGIVSRRLDDGRFRLTRFNEDAGEYEVSTHKNALSMNKRLGEIADGQLKGLKGDEAAEFEGTYRPILMYHQMGKATDYTFDPVKSPNVQDIELKNVEKAKRAKGYVSPIDRQYLSSIEAQDIKKRNAYAGYVDFEPDANTAEAIKKGEPIFDPGSPVEMKQVSKSRTFYSFDNPAMGDELAHADNMARKAIEEGSTESFENLRAKFLIEGGYDGAITPEGTIFTPYPERMKIIADNVDPATGKPLRVNPKGEFRKTRAMVEDTAREKISASEFAGKKKAVAQSLAKVKGDMMDNRNYVAGISENYLKGTGSDIKKVHVYPNRKVKDVSISKVGDNLAVHVPDKIDTFGKQKKFINELMENLNKYAGDGKGVKGRFDEVLSKSPSKFDLPFTGTTRDKWLMSVAREEFGATAKKVGDEIHLKIDGQNKVFKNSSELGDYLLYRTIDESMLSKLLADDGYKMVGNKKKGYVVSGPDGVVARGKDAQQVMDALDWKPDKLPNTFAPKNVIIGDGDITFDFDRSTILGSRKQVLQTLSRFADYSQDSQFKMISSKGDTVIERNQIGRIRVKVPEAGITEYFDDMASAKKFLSEELDTFDGLKGQAQKKGLHLSSLNGDFYLTDGTYRYNVRNLDEVKQVLKEYPDPDGANSIFSSIRQGTEIEKAVSELFEKNMKRQNPLPKGESPPDLLAHASGNPDFMPKGAPSMGFMWNVKRFISRTEEVMEDASKKTGNDAIIKQYRATERAVRFSDADIYDASNYLGEALKGSNGKLLPKSSRRKIYYHMGAQTDDELKKVKEMWGELTPDESRAAEKIRDLLGRDEYSGLFFKFNVGGQKVNGNNFVFNYMPRIRMWMTQADNEQLAKIVSGEDLAKQVWGDNIPKEVRFWAENERASEMLNMAVEDDVFTVVQKYIYQGHRKLYLNPVIRKWNRLYKENPDIPQDFKHAMHSYLDRIKGSQKLPDEKVLSDIGRGIYSALGKTSAKEMQEGANLYRNLFTLNYLTNLSWRPWAAVRNTYQIWTTLAGRYGNETVSRAIRRLDEGGEDVYNYLKRSGIIRDKPPILNNIEDIENKLNDVTSKGLSWFQNSDEYTRAIAFLAAKTQLDEALDASRRGVLRSEEEFAEIAGLNKSAPDIKEEVMSYVRRGGEDDIAAATEVYGDYVVEESMFGYRKSESPALFRGFVGKMFGQYGTFSAGYRANLAHGLRYGSFKDKASFLARFVGNQLSIWGGLYALGIESDDFIPFAPAMFTGGPLFDLTIDMIKGMDPAGYQSGESRRRLAEAFSPVVPSGDGAKFNYPDLLPGALHFHYLKQAYNHFYQDEYFRGFLAMTGAPTVQSTAQ